MGGGHLHASTFKVLFRSRVLPLRRSYRQHMLRSATFGVRLVCSSTAQWVGGCPSRRPLLQVGVPSQRALQLGRHLALCDAGSRDELRLAARSPTPRTGPSPRIVLQPRALLERRSQLRRLRRLHRRHRCRRFVASAAAAAASGLLGPAPPLPPPFFFFFAPYLRASPAVVRAVVRAVVVRVEASPSSVLTRSVESSLRTRRSNGLL